CWCGLCAAHAGFACGGEPALWSAHLAGRSGPLGSWRLSCPGFHAPSVKTFWSTFKILMNQPAALPGLSDTCIALVGLGYVGLPLAVEFGKQYETICFDINSERVAELSAAHDRTRAIEVDVLRSSTRLRFASRLDEIRHCHVYIVTVP